jgi:nicotinate-nucleotide adenylyltransferase
MSGAGPVLVPGAPQVEAPGLVLLYGGTFDPPHLGHIELPRAARRELGADLVLYIPAARSPFKPHGPEATDDDRLAMLGAALEGEAGAAVSTIELARSGQEPSYTIDTVRAMRSALPEGVRLRLLIGADQAAAFHRWRDASELLRLAEPAVFLREPIETAEGLIDLLRPHWAEADAEAWRGRVLRTPLVRISATKVREALSRGGVDGAEARSMLPEGVRRVIRERGLYRDDPARR